MPFPALKTRQRTLLEEADAIAKKAEGEGRGLTDAERTALKSRLEESKAIGAQLRDASAKAGDGGPGAWAEAVRAIGQKALVPSGTISVPAPWTADVAGFGPSPSLLGSLIPTTDLADSDSFSYLRQTVRTNNAEAVARGAIKPTSVISLEKVEDRARTIATLSEPIDNAWVADVRQLASFIENELRTMVIERINAQLIAGDGTGEDIEGLLAVTGRQTQAFDTDVLRTIRKAVTKVGAVYDGLTPDAVVLHPNDAETVDLAEDDEGRYYFGGPVGGGPSDPLWRTPIRVTKAIPEGKAIVANFRAATLAYVREDVRIDWSEAVPVTVGEETVAAFQVNQRVYRAEARVGLAILRPAAIVEVDLVAGS